jgi:hypothetical protein
MSLRWITRVGQLIAGRAARTSIARFQRIMVAAAFGLAEARSYRRQNARNRALPAVEGETSSAIAAVPQPSSARSVMIAIMAGSMPHGSPACVPAPR